MESTWQEIGGFIMAVGVVLYIVREVWKMISATVAQKNGETKKSSPVPGCRLPPDVDIRRLSRQINDLYEWHSVCDDDGVRLWYVRRSVYDMLAQSTQALERISAVLPMLAENQQQMRKELERIQREMRDR
jgi:hypothetical protein